MDKNLISYVTEKTNELINAPSCSSEAKEAAKAWLESVGTDKEAEETKKYIAELEEDIIPIDALLSFTNSEAGKKVFGEERAAAFHAHGEEIKAKGGKYCDCPACTAALSILEKKEDMLK